REIRLRTVPYPRAFRPHSDAASATLAGFPAAIPNFASCLSCPAFVPHSLFQNCAPCSLFPDSAQILSAPARAAPGTYPPPKQSKTAAPVLGISRQSRSRSPASETYPSDMPPTPGTCPGAQPSPSPIGGPATEALLCAPSSDRKSVV